MISACKPMRALMFGAAALALAVVADPAPRAAFAATSQVSITVNKAVITNGDIARRVAFLRLQRQKGDLNKLAKEQLVEESLKRQEIARAGMSVSTQDVDAAFARNEALVARGVNQSLDGVGDFGRRVADLGEAEPFALALALLLVFLGEILEGEWIDLYPAIDGEAILHAFAVVEMPERIVADRAKYAGFLQGFLGGDLIGCLVGHRPALGNDPAAGVAARQQQNLDRVRFRIQAIAQRAVLLSRRAPEHQSDIGSDAGQNGQFRSGLSLAVRDDPLS